MMYLLLLILRNMGTVLKFAGTCEMCDIFNYLDMQSSPVTGLEWHRGFHEFKVPRFNDYGTGWW
jgi:hypothetical protein